MSDHDSRTRNPSSSSLCSPPGSTDPSIDPPRLRREAVVAVNERGRLGLLLALCSLAGVAVGFGLSNINMAASMHGSRCGGHDAMSLVQSCDDTQAPAWLGVRIQDRAQQKGALVVRVEPDSPASRAGLRSGDVVVGFAADGSPTDVSDVRRSANLIFLVRSADIGDHALIIIERNGARRAVRATLEQMPPALFCSTTGR